MSLAAGMALVLLAAALWLVDRSATPRLPGDTITGGQNGTSAALQQASALAATDPAAALAVYDEVLATQPDQPEALTDEGWIYAEGGFVDQAMARLDRAEKVDPSYDAAHFYRGAGTARRAPPGPCRGRAQVVPGPRACLDLGGRSPRRAGTSRGQSLRPEGRLVPVRPPP